MVPRHVEKLCPGPGRMVLGPYLDKAPEKPWWLMSNDRVDGWSR
jgi:hypothetical protein